MVHTRRRSTGEKHMNAMNMQPLAFRRTAASKSMGLPEYCKPRKYDDYWWLDSWFDELRSCPHFCSAQVLRRCFVKKQLPELRKAAMVGPPKFFFACWFQTEWTKPPRNKHKQAIDKQYWRVVSSVSLVWCQAFSRVPGSPSGEELCS